MAKTLSCDYTMELPNFEHISPHGKDFISKLLVLDPKVHITVQYTLHYMTVQYTFNRIKTIIMFAKLWIFYCAYNMLWQI